MAKILVVDDDRNAQEMLCFRLKKEGYEVIQARDGDEGLLLALHKPDLIFLDVRIPKIDGWTLCKMLKDEPRTKHIPIIMLTGCSQPAQEEYGKACGADAYLTKPWKAKELLGIARQILARANL